MTIPNPRGGMPGVYAGDTVPCPRCIDGGLDEGECGSVTAPPQWTDPDDWPVCETCKDDIGEEADQ